MTWLAIAMQVVSSFFFASGAILQSLAVRGTFDPSARASSNQLNLRRMISLFRTPKWLLGLTVICSGAAIHLIALSIAPVTVVQPVGILAVPWAVILSARIHKHPLRPSMWAAVGITIFGVVGLTIISALYAVGAHRFSFGAMFSSFGVVCLICAVLFYVATKTVSWAKAMVWASTGATFYGLASGFMKAGIDLITKYNHSLFEWEFFVTALLTAVCFCLGVWLIQQGFASGPAEITVGTMTTVDPVVAVLFGMIVLGEGAGMGIWPMIGMAVMGAVAIFGVVILSKEHPDAIEERKADADEAPPLDMERASGSPSTLSAAPAPREWSGPR